MEIGTVNIGGLMVSRLIIGSNPFSGFSHQGLDRDQEMRRYFTAARIKDCLRNAEELGINTIIARGDHHIIRLLLEYWDEGGTLQWFTQTCPEPGDIQRGMQNGIKNGAKATFVHGGVMDFLLAQNRLGEVPPAIAMARDAGLAVGVACHNPRVLDWAEEHLDVDFYMCSYYNPTSRDENAEHVSGMPEWFSAKDRDIMAARIQTLSKPAIHYKVMAAGRNDPQEALAFVARFLRPRDAVCMGVFPKDKDGMLAENVRLLSESLAASSAVSID